MSISPSLILGGAGESRSTSLEEGTPFHSLTRQYCSSMHSKVVTEMFVSMGAVPKVTVNDAVLNHPLEVSVSVDSEWIDAHASLLKPG